MSEGAFKFEDCLLKHYIRKNAWLPMCKQRLTALRKSIQKKKEERRLRYFTFCAVGALDVVMLEMERVIRRSSSKKKFDNVVFFDISEEFVVETQKTIPGAVGFPSDFIDVVLTNDPAEPLITADVGSLEAPAEEQNTAATREMQRLRDMKRAFIQSFPFDVINLDLERYLFRPNERLPGKVVRAFRKVFEWQRLAGCRSDGSEYRVEEFTLMFTTRLGPYVADNIAQDQLLAETYARQSGNRSPSDFLATDFEAFFKLAVPKTIVSLLWEEDWEVVLESGVRVFEFQRQTQSDPYRMLHFVMAVRRINPSRENRPPGQASEAARSNYREVIRRIFDTKAEDVADLLASEGEAKVQGHLDRVKAHRRHTSR